MNSKRIKLEHFLTPKAKINLRWIKDLTVRLENIKLLEEHIGRTDSDINFNCFPDLSPKSKETKAKVSET